MNPVQFSVKIDKQIQQRNLFFSELKEIPVSKGADKSVIRSTFCHCWFLPKGSYAPGSVL